MRKHLAILVLAEIDYPNRFSLLLMHRKFQTLPIFMALDLHQIHSDLDNKRATFVVKGVIRVECIDIVQPFGHYQKVRAILS
jgi:hypothetical protein